MIGGLLIGIVLNPSLLYANQTTVSNYTIHYNSEINKDLLNQLETVTSLLTKSELYDSTFELDICLNDGSYYPLLLENIRGQAFAWGFYNKIVLLGNANYKDNYLELNGYNWNLEQLIAHEAIHCYQYNKLGFLDSNPIAKHPNWKWEGYPEYISRQNYDQQDLYQNIEHLLSYEKNGKVSWDIKFSDSSISPINYYKDWLLVKYCMDMKQLSYEDLLNDPTEKEVVQTEMMKWFKDENKKRTYNKK